MDILTYALAKNYTDKALLGVGTIKGAPCTVKSQTEDDEYVYVTLGWENNLGTPEETVVKIKKGADGAPGEPGPAGDPGPQGASITKIEKIKTEGLIDTYQISFSDNTTFEYTISNGSTDYLNITNKPSIEGVELTGNKTFEDLNIASADALTATDGHLQNLSDLIGDKTSLPAPTDTVVNNIASVDAKVDAIIDDNEAGLAKTFSSDKITKTFATIEEVNERIPQYDILPTPAEAFGGKIVQFIGTTTEDYIHNYFYECVEVEGSYKWINVAVQNIPTKVSELTNDNNFVTEAELNEKGYLTEHQDISGKVDKEEGKSLIANSEITRLSTVKNYDDSVVKEDIDTIKTDYATKTYVGEQIAAADHLKREIVTEVPTVETAAENVIYMLKVESAIGADKYKEYMLIDGEVACIGDTSVDLTDYAKKSEIPTELPANGGNSDTVNNHTVETDVPTDAKFTDTVYDDTEIDNRVKVIENDYIKTIDLAAVAKSGSYNDLVDTPTIPSVEGLAKIEDIPTKVSELENDSNYLSSIPDEYITETELEEKGYLTEHQDISGKVDKVEGKSLISDAEIARLASVDNYDDTDIKAEIAKKADATAIPSKVSELTNDSNYQTAEQVNSTITTEIAKVVADAPEDFDTLKEMSDWIAGHEDDASAMNSAILDNKTAISALQTGKADKSEIPTTLPADGGNADTVNSHTVASDVPENAVFTDTVYDDTEVKESIENLNSDLDTLEFGEVAGGKNIAHDVICEPQTGKWGNLVSGYAKLIQGIEYTMSFTVTSNGSGNIYIPSSSGFESGNPVININSGTTRITRTVHAIGNDGITKSTFVSTYENNSATISITDFMIEEGSTATEYEPYIPSVKMLADENTQQSNSIMDLKMLGWTVPSECTVQNYVDSDGVFHQIVGRVDLGSLYWSTYNFGGINCFYALVKERKVTNNNIYTSNYSTSNSTPSMLADKEINGTSNENYIYIRDNTYGTNVNRFKQAVKGEYLYFELAEEKTISVDGNEAVTKVNESLSVIGKCKNLLNPTLQTTTVNGITCTNNGDGTYTLNGTATKKADFSLFTSLEKHQHLKNKTVKLVGCPKGGSTTTYRLFLQLQKDPWTSAIDDGKGSSVTIDNNDNWACWIRIYKDVTLSNLTFKPMITTNLNATYDDFVPYTGDGETLTADVAVIKKDIGNLTGDIDAKTVNGHTVESNVPADAKFTDTVYDDTSIKNKLTTHTHDDRYYTETEVNNLLNGKANSSHSHGAYELPVGSIFLSSRKVAPSYGNWEYLGTIQSLFSDLPLIQAIGEGYVYNRTL